MQVAFLVLGTQHVHDFAVLWSARWALSLTLCIAFKTVLVEGVAAQEMNRRQLQGTVAHVTLGLLEYFGTVWKYWGKHLQSICDICRSHQYKLFPSPHLPPLPPRASVAVTDRSNSKNHKKWEWQNGSIKLVELLVLPIKRRPGNDKFAPWLLKSKVTQKSHLTCDQPCFELLDLRTEVSCFLAVLADFAFIVLYLLALPLQLVDEVVLDDGKSGRRVVCQCLHHYGRTKIMDLMLSKHLLFKQNFNDAKRSQCSVYTWTDSNITCWLKSKHEVWNQMFTSSPSNGGIRLFWSMWCRTSLM